MTHPVLEALELKRARLTTEMDEIVARGSTRADGKLLASEQRTFEKLALKIQKLDRQAKPLREQEKRLANAARAQMELHRVSIGDEARTYRPAARDERGEEYGYLSDFVLRTKYNDEGARQRLERHEREVATELAANPQLAAELRINPNTTAGTGGDLVPPIWLTASYIAALRAGRATADLCQGFPMVPGTDLINVPKIATGSSVQVQTANAAPVASVDITTTVVAAPVITVAGQPDISMQLLEQSPVAMDGVVFGDLGADLQRTIDKQVINGSGSNGQLTGLLNVASIGSVTFTSGSPTAILLFPLIAQAINQVTAARFLPPTAIVMAPRRWLWLASQLDGQNRPLVIPSSTAWNEMAQSTEDLVEGKPVGKILGIDVYIDQNLPNTNGAGSNEDVILVARFDDNWLYESTVRLRMLPEILSGSLQVRLQAYEYLAFAPRLAQSICKISGTGLIGPSGWT